jgi:hypothetical protein
MACSLLACRTFLRSLDMSYFPVDGLVSGIRSQRIAALSRPMLACRFQRCFEAGHFVALPQRLIGELIEPLARLGIASGVRSEGCSALFVTHLGLGIDCHVRQPFGKEQAIRLMRID